MNKNLVVAVVCLLLSALFVYLGGRSDEPRALLIPAQPFTDFGECKEGDHQKKIELKNVSEERLQIINVRKSCRCNHVKVSSKIVEPKESVFLEVEWDLRGQPHNARADLLINYKTVPSHDQTLSTLLTLKAEVDPDFFFPREIGFKPAELKKEITLVLNVDNNAQITEVTCAHPAFTVGLKSPTQIQIEINPQMEISDRRIQLNVTTNNANSPTLVVPIVVEKSRCYWGLYFSFSYWES